MHREWSGSPQVGSSPELEVGRGVSANSMVIVLGFMAGWLGSDCGWEYRETYESLDCGSVCEGLLHDSSQWISIKNRQFKVLRYLLLWWKVALPKVGLRIKTFGREECLRRKAYWQCRPGLLSLEISVLILHDYRSLPFFCYLCLR